MGLQFHLSLQPTQVRDAPADAFAGTARVSAMTSKILGYRTIDRATEACVDVGSRKAPLGELGNSR
jgi:hypothetical protein